MSCATNVPPVGIADPEQHARVVADELPEVGRDVHHDEALDAVRPLGLDAEPAPHRARRAVAREQPPTPHLERAAGPGHPRGHATLVARGALPTVCVAQVAAADERVDEQGFEAVLGEVAQRRRCDRELIVALALVGQARDDLSAELRDPVHRARVGGVLRVRADVVDVEAHLAPDLERAGVDRVRRGRPLRSVAPLHEQHGATEPLEQQRGGEADRPGAHDEHVDVDAFHQISPA